MYLGIALGLATLLGTIFSLPACYTIPEPDCGFVCGPAGECPDGYACSTLEPRCHRIGTDPALRCDPEADAAIDVPLDVPDDVPVDAPDDAPDAMDGGSDAMDAMDAMDGGSDAMDAMDAMDGGSDAMDAMDAGTDATDAAIDAMDAAIDAPPDA